MFKVFLRVKPLNPEERDAMLRETVYNYLLWRLVMDLMPYLPPGRDTNSSLSLKLSLKIISIILHIVSDSDS